MATIRTSIMVNDMMSQQFRAMNMAMSTVIDSFYDLQDATSKAVDVSALESAQRELQLVEASYNQIEDEIRQANQQQQRLNSNIDEGSNLMKRFGGAVLGVVSAYASYRGLMNLVDMSDEYAHSTARIAMMNDGLQTTGELYDKVYQAAQSAFTPINDMTEMVGKLGNNAASAFSSSAEIVDFAELIQKQFTVAGTSAIEASNASLQLTQALGSGVLRGDELNSIFEQAPNIIQNIANYLDVPIGSIREMASEGKLTAEIVKQSMFAAADDINHKFDSMPKSWNGAWTIMTNYAEDKMGSVAHRINDFINSANFAYLQQMVMGAVDVIVAGINIAVAMLIWFGNTSAVVAQFFSNNWSWIAPILIVIGVILAGIATMIVAGLVPATWAWLKAQMAVNMAFLANPIFWVLIAIIAIIGLVVYAIVVWGEQTATVIGFIIGLFLTLGAYVYNMVAFWYNLFLSFAEFFINVFIDPTYTVKKLFYDLVMLILNYMGTAATSFDKVANVLANAFVTGANIAITAINWVIEALNKIPGIEIGTMSKLSAGTSAALSNRIQNFAAGLEAPTSDKNVVSLSRMDFANLPSMFQTGYDWGYSGTMTVSHELNGLVDRAKGLADFEGSGNSALQSTLDGYGLGGTNYGLDDGMGNLADAIEKGNGAGKKTAANTKKLADSVDMAAEDLAYMKDMAEKDAINRYTTGEIKVNMKNENHISKDMDIDGIIDRFAEKLEEAVETVAEGDDDDV